MPFASPGETMTVRGAEPGSEACVEVTQDAYVMTYGPWRVLSGLTTAFFSTNERTERHRQHEADLFGHTMKM